MGRQKTWSKLKTRSGWRSMWFAFWYSVKDLFTDGGMHWAGSIAFYSFLSAFPLFLVLVSIGSFFVEPDWVIQQLTDILAGLLPEGEEQVRDIVETAYATRGGAGLASIGVLMWSGTRVFGTLTTALNIAFDVGETYGLLKRFAYEVGHMLTIGVLFVIAVASRSGINWLLNQTGVAGDEAAFFIDAIPLIASFLLLTLTFGLIYRFVPRRRPRGMSAIIGAVTAALIFVLARPLFWYYIVHFADYGSIYGPVALVVTLVFWVWLAALIVLFGAEVASHVQSLVVDEMSVEEVRRRHRKRSPIKSEPGKDEPDKNESDQDDSDGQDNDERKKEGEQAEKEPEKDYS